VNRDSTLADRTARRRLIQDLIAHLSQPYGRNKIALHHADTGVWLDCHQYLVELRADSTVFHESTNLTEDDFALQ